MFSPGRRVPEQDNHFVVAIPLEALGSISHIVPLSLCSTGMIWAGSKDISVTIITFCAYTCVLLTS